MHKLSKHEPFKKFTVKCTDTHNTTIFTNSLLSPLVKAYKRYISQIIDNETDATIFLRPIPNNTSQPVENQTVNS
jgi:hypothetical protein